MPTIGPIKRSIKFACHFNDPPLVLHHKLGKILNQNWTLMYFVRVSLGLPFGESRRGYCQSHLMGYDL